MKRFGLIGALAGASLAAAASPASASVTIGQLGPIPANQTCTLLRDRVQPTVTSGNSYVVPNTAGVGNWTLTSWSHNAGPGAGQTLELKIFRKVADPTAFMAVAHDVLRSITASTLNTFPVKIPVKAGDILGTVQTSAAPVACSFTAPGEAYQFRDGNLADGAQGTFAPFTGVRLNVAAVVTPTNSFTIGKVKRNKKKGTAALTLNVPNPGNLAVGGKGVKPATTAAGAAGDVTVTIKSKGKKRGTLNSSGKVSVTPAITFTPSGGDGSTQSPSVKLKKSQ